MINHHLAIGGEISFGTFQVPFSLRPTAQPQGIRLIPIQRREGSAAVTPPRVSGIAAPFFQLSEVIAGEAGPPHRQMIWPGAFKDSLRTDPIDFRVGHRGISLGSTDDGRLRLWEDERGLRFAFTPPRSAEGDAFVSQVRRGVFAGMSMRCWVSKSLWVGEGDDLMKAVKEISLDHIAAVTNPAFPQTTIRIEG